MFGVYRSNRLIIFNCKCDFRKKKTIKNQRMIVQKNNKKVKENLIAIRMLLTGLFK